MENMINESVEAESSLSKVEKVDIKAVRFEQDKSKFYEKINIMINDAAFVNKCKKYLEIKNNKN